MSVENLGQPLTGVYSIPGGQARLYERGMTVNGVIVSFAFPMIGRPSIATGNSSSATPFEPDAINFGLGNSQLEQTAPMIQNALAGRLTLVPTRQATGRVPLTIGPAVIVTPEKRPGAGGIVIPAVYGMSVTTAALRERQLYDVAVLADGGRWHIVAPPNAAWMVDVDPEIKGYKTYLADRRSYVVRLGKHRIAMLDSGSDVGMVTDVIGALTALIAQQGEDKVTFLGGSPNSEGMSPEELALVWDALTEVPDGWTSESRGAKPIH